MNSRFYLSILIFVIIGFDSCIEPYIPENVNKIVPKVVVDGLITNQSEEQEIVLSYTSSPNNSKFIPLSGCTVEVIDGEGSIFNFNESYSNTGHYIGSIGMQYLNAHHQFKLHFVTSSGEEFESSMEEMMPCPPVDSVYYSVGTEETTIPSISYEGIQFYIDLIANENDGSYYRVSVEETWEYHAAYPVGIYFAGEYYHHPADYSLYYCYSSNQLDNIFLISTTGFSKNEYKKYQLNFVTNQTQRLMYKYSMLIKQMSISEGAYNFWSNLRKNNQQSGGLYDTQPAIVEGNIHSLSDPNEKVLGYFGVSSVQTKRIFVTNVPISFPYDFHCTPSVPYYEGGWPYNTSSTEWPIYFINYLDFETGATILGVADKDCFDCRLNGGTTEKPVYWDDDLKCNE